MRSDPRQLECDSDHHTRTQIHQLSNKNPTIRTQQAKTSTNPTSLPTPKTCEIVFMLVRFALRGYKQAHTAAAECSFSHVRINTQTSTLKMHNLIKFVRSMLLGCAGPCPSCKSIYGMYMQHSASQPVRRIYGLNGHISVICLRSLRRQPAAQLVAHGI